VPFLCMDLYITLSALYICFLKGTCVSDHSVVNLSVPYNSLIQNIYNIKGRHIEPVTFLS